MGIAIALFIIPSTHNALQERNKDLREREENWGLVGPANLRIAYKTAWALAGK